MKLYILICSNEEHQIVSCNAYKTHDQAATKLAGEYYAEFHDKLTTYQGNERFINANLETTTGTAYVTYNEFGYFWEIKEINVPE